MASLGQQLREPRTLIVVVALTLLVLGSVAYNLVTSPDGRLASAYEECQDEVGGSMRLTDEEHTLVLDTFSEDEPLDKVLCALGELETPNSITSEMGSTTALMGAQDAESDGLHYRWTYHPDNGINLIVTDKDED